MGITNSFYPAMARIEQFKGEISTEFMKAVDNVRGEIKQVEQREATDRLYGQHSKISMYENMKVNSQNAKKVANVFKLMETYKTVDANNTPTIKSLGKERGFDEEESLCIYNMQRYTRAVENLSSQKDQMVRLLLDTV
jgi:hypothetical protein